MNMIINKTKQYLDEDTQKEYNDINEIQSSTMIVDNNENNISKNI
jgi:hypothetical protein